AADVARKVHAALDTPLALASVLIDVKASIGIAIYPLHADDAGTLIQRADIAMYEAKQNHSEFAMYEPGRDEHSLRRLSLISELRHAAGRGELELAYQPKIDMHVGRMIHVEALVRWRHPQHGLLPPDEFVPLAEQSGNISILTKWVLRTAIRQCAAWRDQGLDLTVAVNLSALDLFDADLPS